MKYKNCRNCGHSNPMENRYCSKCGTAFRNMVPQREIDEHKNCNKKTLALTLIISIIVVASIVILLRTLSSPPQPAIESTTASCTHVWLPADCTTPKTCAICGEESGTVLEHQWKEATYNSPRICSACGATDGTPVEKPSVKVNDIVTFGSYEQDGLRKNGAEPIEWLVLDVQGDKVLLLSCYALDSKPYNDTYGSTTWEKCTLRNWLNSTFLDTAFTDEEQKKILLTEIDNGNAQGNREWRTNGGNNTEDAIFLLSYADTDRYFDGAADRICMPTNYAVAMGADTRILDDGITEAGWWWLRSPGEAEYHAAFVNYDGTRYTNAVGNEYLSVRPALWISLDGK